MDYPKMTLNNQSDYPSQPQDPTRVSSAYVQQSFPSMDCGQNHRGYPNYSQSFQPSSELSSSASHAPPPSSYPSNYPEMHSQSLTLNQLLQGGTPTNYPVRSQAGPPGQPPYRGYDGYGYGYKPGVPGSSERSQAGPPYASAYPTSQQQQQPRYPNAGSNDSAYQRPPFTGGYTPQAGSSGGGPQQQPYPNYYQGHQRPPNHIPPSSSHNSSDFPSGPLQHRPPQASPNDSSGTTSNHTSRMAAMMSTPGGTGGMPTASSNNNNHLGGSPGGQQQQPWTQFGPRAPNRNVSPRDVQQKGLPPDQQQQLSTEPAEGQQPDPGSSIMPDETVVNARPLSRLSESANRHGTSPSPNRPGSSSSYTSGKPRGDLDDGAKSDDISDGGKPPSNRLPSSPSAKLASAGGGGGVPASSNAASYSMTPSSMGSGQPQQQRSSSQNAAPLGHQPGLPPNRHSPYPPQQQHQHYMSASSSGPPRLPPQGAYSTPSAYQQHMQQQQMMRPSRPVMTPSSGSAASASMMMPPPPSSGSSGWVDSPSGPVMLGRPPSGGRPTMYNGSQLPSGGEVRSSSSGGGGPYPPPGHHGASYPPASSYPHQQQPYNNTPLHHHPSSTYQPASYARGGGDPQMMMHHSGIPPNQQQQFVPHTHQQQQPGVMDSSSASNQQAQPDQMRSPARKGSPAVPVVTPTGTESMEPNRMRHLDSSGRSTTPGTLLNSTQSSGGGPPAVPGEDTGNGLMMPSHPMQHTHPNQQQHHHQMHHHHQQQPPPSSAFPPGSSNAGYWGPDHTAPHHTMPGHPHHPSFGPSPPPGAGVNFHPHHHHYRQPHPGMGPYGQPPQQPPSVLPPTMTPQTANCLRKLLEMGSEPDRRPWLEHYIRFMDEIGKPLVGIPQIVKQPLDLYRFYLAVRERGGVIDVIKARRWKEISQLVNINASASAAYTLRKNYCKFLLDYECRFDRGGVDPRPMLSQIEAMSSKKKKPSSATSIADVVVNNDVSLSSSGFSQPAMPLSPTGSHSSASSSLLPPGSSSNSASLSGIPGIGSQSNDTSAMHPHNANAASTATNTSGVGESLGGLETSNGSNAGCSSPAVVVKSTATLDHQSAVNGQVPSSDHQTFAGRPSWSNWSMPPNEAGRQSPLVMPNGSQSSNRVGPGRPNQSGMYDGPDRAAPRGVPVGLPTSSCTTPSYVPDFAKQPSTSGTGSSPANTPLKMPPNVDRVAATSQQAPPLPPPPNTILHHGRGPQVAAMDPAAMHAMLQQRRGYPQPGQPPSSYLSVSGGGGGGGSTSIVSGNGGVPAHLVHHGRPSYVATIFKRVEHYPFPTGSVEATQVETSRKRRYRTKDLGPMSSFKMLMALRSGLTAEVSWALNSLNVLLRDETSGCIELLGPACFPSLATNLVELWRRTLGELFEHSSFISGLELPIDFRLPSTSDAPDLVVPDLLLENAKPSPLLPDHFSDIESEIMSEAKRRGIHPSALRAGIHSLIVLSNSKHDIEELLPLRSRNGLTTLNNSHPCTPTDGDSLSSVEGFVSGRASRLKRGRTQPLANSPMVNVTIPGSQLPNSQLSVEGAPTKRRITFSSKQLRTPEALKNIRELASFVINELSPDSAGPFSDVDSYNPHEAICLLHDLLLQGGGDTTCHIMPPFGASIPKRNCSPSMSSTVKHHEVNPPSTVDDHPPTPKRTRHGSASSLSCPALSPQLIDDPPDIESSVDEADDTVDASHAPGSDQCPLRARQELVHHGVTCLWPDFSEAVGYESHAVRCLCVSTVVRNLSFFTQFESHLSKHSGLLTLLGRVLLLGHDHVQPSDTWQSVESNAKLMTPAMCAWRTPTWMDDMRQNVLVTLVNLAGQLDLIKLHERIARPILEGILHWIICPTAAASDPFPGHRLISPRRLALEALNRLCVHQSNVDLLLVTDTELVGKLFDRLSNWLSLPEDQVTRELALSTMHYLAGGGSSGLDLEGQAIGKRSAVSGVNAKDLSSSTTSTNYVGTIILAHAEPCPISGLLAFIESAEVTTRRVIDQVGVQALQERPELMGTSLEMVRRAGALIDRLAANKVGRGRFTPNHEVRLIELVTSRVLDATVAHILCGALHRVSITPSFGKQSKQELPSVIVSPLVPSIPSPVQVADILAKLVAKQTLSTDASSPKVSKEGIAANSSASADSKDGCSTDVPPSSPVDYLKLKSKLNGPTLTTSEGSADENSVTSCCAVDSC